MGENAVSWTKNLALDCGNGANVMADRRKKCRGRSKNSAKNGAYTQDFFQKKARDLGMRARSYFKLEHIDTQFNLIKPNKKYLDLGASPGSWSEYIAKKTKEKTFIMLVDLVKPLPIASSCPKMSQCCLEGNVYDLCPTDVLPRDGSLYDGVLSDMAPATIGEKDADSYASYELVLEALRLAEGVLKKDGFFLAKYLEGGEMPQLKSLFQEKMGSLRVIRPPSTRKFSREVFLLAKKN